MAKKKVVKKDSKNVVKSKSIASKLTKSVSKLTQKVVAAVSKTAKKATPEVKPKKIEKINKPAAKIVLKSAPKAAVKVTLKPAVKPAVKPTAKTAPKTLEKKSKPVEVEIEEEVEEEIEEEIVEENTGDTLIGMAKAEMAAVKIGQTAEKVEKASKFKAIKVERGNASDEKAKWQELFKRHGKDKATTYKMTDTFESLKPIEHKILGWGFVLTNDNDRLEVLFENGIKMLISNYKPN